MMSRKETKELLSSMVDKGYTKIGVIFKSHGVLDILLIHKDWATYDFQKQFAKAVGDLPKKIKQQYMFSLEIPTREMYDNERTENSPNHKILVDLGPYPDKSLWVRKGFFYYGKVTIHRGVYKWEVTKRLGFFSYHLIRRIHGLKGLNEMLIKVNF
jgi:hypothetical protein